MNPNLTQLRERFERNGFVVMHDVLNAHQINHFTEVVDRLAHEERGADETKTVEIRNTIAHDTALLPLLNWQSTFPLIANILGWNIQLTTSHVFVRPPTPKEDETFKAIPWHNDGPVPIFPVVNNQQPRMYAKVGFFLTDLSKPDMGNLRAVPGSHLCAERPKCDDSGEPTNAI